METPKVINNEILEKKITQPFPTLSSGPLVVHKVCILPFFRLLQEMSNKYCKLISKMFMESSMIL